MSKSSVFKAAIAILALSTTAVFFIPWGPFLGLDFQNLDAFHDCFAQDNPYLSTGEACGDYLGRGMTYPPVLYWFFAWTRLLPFEAGYVLWAVVTAVFSATAMAMWVPAARRNGPMLLFGGLLMLQYPMLFALERGNNDVIVLVLWSLSAWLLLNHRPGWAGFLAGLSVLFKLYPAFSVIVVLAGLLSASWATRAFHRRSILYCAGGLAAAIVASVPFIGQISDFARTQLPVLLAFEADPTIASHAITFIAPGGASWVLSLPLLAVWAWAAHRQMERDPVLVLAGALAISTYFSNLSVDYNLITTYPLLLVLFTRATATSTNAATVALLLIGLIAIIGHRAVFVLADFELGSLAHIWLQWGWLMAAGAGVAWSRISHGDTVSDEAEAGPRQGRPRFAIPDAEGSGPA